MRLFSLPEANDLLHHTASIGGKCGVGLPLDLPIYLP